MLLKKKYTFIFFFLFWVCSIVYADTVDTQLSKDKVSLGETLTISYHLNSAVAVNASPDFSAFNKDFRIIGTNYGTTIQIVNGVTQAQTYWEVMVEPKSIGDLVIPEIDFGNGKSVPRKLSVEEGVTAVQANTQENSSEFVKANVNKTNPYIQSQVLYTFKLFFRSQLANPKLELPQIQDAVLAQVGEEKFYQTSIKGEPFYVFEKNFAIFPQKTGKINIPPTRFHGTQVGINPNLIDDPFSMPTNKVVNLATPSFTLEVKKIPDNYEGKIWLPAEQITVAEKWSGDPVQWEIGTPMTRTITIEAQGLRADQIPDLVVDKIQGVNVYADTPRRSNSTQGNGVLGTWQQKITYIPNQVQSFTIPSVKLYWWNTQTNSNAIAQLQSVTVQIQGKISNPGPIPPTIAPSVNPNEITKPKLDELVQPKTQTLPFYLSIWFWISILLSLSWAITLWWIWKSKSSKPIHLIVEPSHDKAFVLACEQGNSLLAQKHLLLWAKSQWQNPPTSLGKLSEMIDDESFKKEIAYLEQTLYAGQLVKWDGASLLAAFQKLRKHKKNNFMGSKKNKIEGKQGLLDPLPPLYP